VAIVLLDTTVASLLHPRRESSALRARYEPHLKAQILALSFQSVAELWAWAEERNWGAKERRRLGAFLRRFLIIPYDAELARVWARVSVACKRQGRRLEAGDAWIVATAVHRRIQLLSHDRDHVGLRVPGLEVVSHVESSERQPEGLPGATP
jgi:tRNA(fMet)-specific endonuclease VapC